MEYRTERRLRRVGLVVAGVAGFAAFAGAGAAAATFLTAAEGTEDVATESVTVPTAVFGPTPTTAPTTTTTMPPTTTTTAPPTTTTTAPVAVLPDDPEIRVPATVIAGTGSPTEAPPTTVPPLVSITAIYVVPERDARHEACLAEQNLFFPDVAVHDGAHVLLGTQELPEDGTFVTDEAGANSCEFEVTFEVPLGPSYEFVYGVQETAVSAADLERDGSKVRIVVDEYPT